MEASRQEIQDEQDFEDFENCRKEIAEKYFEEKCEERRRKSPGEVWSDVSAWQRNGQQEVHIDQLDPSHSGEESGRIFYNPLLHQTPEI